MSSIATRVNDDIEEIGDIIGVTCIVLQVSYALLINQGGKFSCILNVFIIQSKLICWSHESSELKLSTPNIKERERKGK